MPARQHLTIAEKRLLREHAQSNRNKTQKELIQWVKDSFGKTISQSSISTTLPQPIPAARHPDVVRASRVRVALVLADSPADAHPSALNGMAPPAPPTPATDD
jgi:hypothetical protein